MIPLRLKHSAVPALLTLVALSGLHVGVQAQAPAAPAAKSPALADFNKCAKPVWPKEALRRELQGTVTMEFKIDADGSVAESRVLKSSGSPLLDEAARFGLAKCKFHPNTLDGKAQPTWMKIQYVWTLDSGELNPALQAAFAETRAAAEAGDGEAQFRLAELYGTGKGVKRDYAQAYAWMKQAAETGNADAQSGLAMMLQRGYGVTVDLGLAKQWRQKAAEQGHRRAMYTLGIDYMTGSGGIKDAAQAMAWLRKAADAGLPEAYPALAWLYESGQGVERSHDEAMQLLRRGAELGDALAQLRLGMELYRSQSPRDHAEAVALLEKAVVKGDARGQVMLGRAYREGQGVTADAGTAAEWFRKAAAQSNVEAQYALAVLLEQGSGVPKDEAEALRLYELAAKSGWNAAVLRMLKVAERGELGRPVDVAEAAKWRGRLPDAKLVK